MSTRIFALMMKEIFMRALEIMRQMVTASICIWIWILGNHFVFIDSVFHFLGGSEINLGPLSHTRLRTYDHYTLITPIGGKGGAGPSSLHTMLEGPTKYVNDGCNVYMVSYMASNGSYFMVTWTIFQNHLLEIGLMQYQETMALWMLTTVGSFYFIMCDPHE